MCKFCESSCKTEGMVFSELVAEFCYEHTISFDTLRQTTAVLLHRWATSGCPRCGQRITKQPVARPRRIFLYPQ